jgi:UDP-glucuronate 4-epimerase
MTVLITGGAGFIGSTIADRLLEEGEKVVVIDNMDDYYDPALKERNIAEAKTNDRYRFYRGDIRDAALLGQIFSENPIELVIHLAAKAGVRPSLANPELYYDVNVMGTLRLLEAMRAAGVKKLLFASSSSVYGNNKKTPFSESDNVDFPISPYAASKKAGELLCYNYHHLYDFDIFCLRYFTVYGPRQRPEMAISLFTRHIRDGLPIKMFGDGSSARDYTFIDDIVQGVLLAAKKLKGYDIINLGESSTISLKGMIETVEKVVGKKAMIEPHPMQPGDVNLTFADISRAREKLGYQPMTDIENGIKKYYKWLELTEKEQKR